jgi:hypothetical protein
MQQGWQYGQAPNGDLPTRLDIRIALPATRSYSLPMA